MNGAAVEASPRRFRLRNPVLIDKPTTPVVDVWCVQLDTPGLVASLRPLLSSDELERAGRLRFERDQQRFIAARGVLRVLLGRYVKRQPSELQFKYGRVGKPALASPCDPELYFNVAHSDSAGIFAFSYAGEVGVDVELIREIPEIDELSARYFSATERSVLQRIDTPKRTYAFFRCWTRKEAFIKALGEGLSHPLNSFSVTVDRDDPIHVEWVAEDPQAARRWTLRHIDLGDNFVGAVATQMPDALIQIKSLSNPLIRTMSWA